MLTSEERKEKMGLDRYERMIEKRMEKIRLSNLVIEALGESDEIFQ